MKPTASLGHQLHQERQQQQQSPVIMRRPRLLTSFALCASFVARNDGTNALLIDAFSTSSLVRLQPPSVGRPSPPSSSLGGLSRRLRRLRPSSGYASPGPVGRSELFTVTKTHEFKDIGSIDADLQLVYQRVAQRDPEWFEAFVVPAWDIVTQRKSTDDDDGDSSLGAAATATWLPIRALDSSSGSDLPKEQRSMGPSVDELVAELARLDESFVRLTQRKKAKQVEATIIVTTVTVADSEVFAAAAEAAVGVASADTQQLLESSSARQSEVVVDVTETRAGSNVAAPSPLSDAEDSMVTAGFVDAESEVRGIELDPITTTASSGEAIDDVPVSEVMDFVSAMEDDGSTGSAPAVDDRASTESVGAASTTTSESVDTMERNDVRVVVYPDASSSRDRGEFVTVPFSKLEELGYREADVLSLRPEALDLIIAERVPRPRSGVPERWKRRLSSAGDVDNNVRIVLAKEVKEIIEDQKSRSSRKPDATKPDAKTTTLDSDAAVAPDGIDVEEESPIREPPRRAVDSRDPSSVRSRESASARRMVDRRSRGEDGRSRPIYSGRPVRRDRTTAAAGALADPPKPSAFWPDIDTFRDLLRKEASLRLRILGNDWAGVVKDESDWRLDLYTSWLWTLHNGVGDPIVESRSDRMRRRTTSSGSGPLPPMTPRTPPSSSKARKAPTSRERKRPNPETT